ncbi:MAG: right-handed parallel beta-helix repeat-containing protein [Actinomycetota bacterium]
MRKDVRRKMGAQSILDSDSSEHYLDLHEQYRSERRRARRPWRWLGRLVLVALVLGLAAAAVMVLAARRGPQVSAPDLTSVDQGQIRPSLDDAVPTDRTETSIASSSVDTDPDLLWVDPANGDDGNDGQTSATAWASLQRAMDALEPGQTLHLMSGRYQELLEEDYAHYILTNGGTEDAWVTITAAPGERPVLAPNGGNALVIRADYVEIVGLDVVGEGYGIDNPYGWGVLVHNAHHVRIKGNRVSQMPVGGIGTIGSSNVEILYNEVFQNSYWGTEQGSGISVWHATDLGFGPAVDGYHDAIVGNVVYGNENKVYSRFVPGQQAITDGNGIIIDQTDESGYTGRFLIANNVVFDNGGRAVIVNESSRVDVVHNTTFGNGRTEELLGGKTELAAARSSDVQFLNNLAWSRPGAESMRMTDVRDITMGGNVFVTDIHTGPDTDLDLVIDTDPGLVSPGVDPEVSDFQPLPSSLLVGRAIPTSPHVPFDAILGARPAAGGTVGAYEPAS